MRPADASAAPATWRSTQKANRRAELLRSAARLFAERGYASVSTVELGDAVGISGPALYRHFASKEAMLQELLIDASERLLEGAAAIIGDDREGGAGQTSDQGAPDAAAALLRRLVAFHLEFATSDPDVIRIQDRELAQLAPDANHRVRSLQRRYVQEWDAVLAAARPGIAADERQIRLLATFGLLNSTPHSGSPTRPADAAAVLEAMALRALLGTDPAPAAADAPGPAPAPVATPAPAE